MEASAHPVRTYKVLTHLEVIAEVGTVKIILAHPKHEGVDSPVFRCKLKKLGPDPLKLDA